MPSHAPPHGLYRVRITIHGVPAAGRAASDLAADLGTDGLGATALSVESDSHRHDVEVVFDSRETTQALEDPATDLLAAESCAALAATGDERAALLPVVRAMLALARAREHGVLPPHRRMTIEVEPVVPATETLPRP